MGIYVKKRNFAGLISLLLILIITIVIIASYYFVFQENNKIEVVLLGGYLWEKIERISYLSYRLFLKLKLNENPFFCKLYKQIKMPN